MQKLLSTEEWDQLATQIRRDILRMVYEVQSGHPGGSLGCVEFFLSLYFEQLNANPANFNLSGIGEDVFILSNGHISPVLYSTLARVGYFPLAELSTFRKINSRLQGHPSVDKGLPGVRISTGSLGQGLSVAIGIALAKKLVGDENWVYVLMGDGENQEGQIWEAANFASHHKVDNLIAFVDLNFKQIDGDTRAVQNTESLSQKWRAFNWEVLEILNGNDRNEVRIAFEQGRNLARKNKPVVILLHTIMGKGIDFMEDQYQWHGKAPAEKEYVQALAQLPLSLVDY